MRNPPFDDRPRDRVDLAPVLPRQPRRPLEQLVLGGSLRRAPAVLRAGQAGERARTLAGHAPLQEHPSLLQPSYAVVLHRRVPVQSTKGFYWVSTKAQPGCVRGFSV